MKVRIVNDGGPGYATKITNAETGEDLSGLQLTEAHIRVRDNIPTIILTSVLPVLDITGEAKIIYRCPHCGKALEKQTPPSDVSPTKEMLHKLEITQDKR
jgi:hypothetical protein